MIMQISRLILLLVLAVAKPGSFGANSGDIHDKCGFRTYCHTDTGKIVCENETYFTKSKQFKCTCGKTCEFVGRKDKRDNKLACGVGKWTCKLPKGGVACEGESFVSKDGRYNCTCGKKKCQYIGHKMAGDSGTKNVDHGGVRKCGTGKWYCKIDVGKYACHGESYTTKDGKLQCICGHNKCKRIGGLKRRAAKNDTKKSDTSGRTAKKTAIVKNPGVEKCGEGKMFCKTDVGNYACEGEAYFSHDGLFKCICGQEICEFADKKKQNEPDNKKDENPGVQRCGYNKMFCQTDTGNYICKGEYFVTKDGDFKCTCGQKKCESLKKKNPGVEKCGYYKLYCQTDIGNYICEGESFVSKDGQFKCTCGKTQCENIQKPKFDNPGVEKCGYGKIYCKTDTGRYICRGESYITNDGYFKCTCGETNCEAVRTKKFNDAKSEKSPIIKHCDKAKKSHCKTDDGQYVCEGDSYFTKDRNSICTCGKTGCETVVEKMLIDNQRTRAENTTQGDDRMSVTTQLVERMSDKKVFATTPLVERMSDKKVSATTPLVERMSDKKVSATTPLVERMSDKKVSATTPMVGQVSATTPMVERVSERMTEHKDKNLEGQQKCGKDRTFCANDAGGVVCEGEEYLTDGAQLRCTCGQNRCVYIGQKEKEHAGAKKCGSGKYFCYHPNGSFLCEKETFSMSSGKFKCTCGKAKCELADH